MEYLKNIPLEDLKKDYSTRLGFVFRGPTKSSDKAIEHLCNMLIHHNITKEFPEFVTRIDDLNVAFVYKDDFDCPPFFQHAQIAMRMGVCQIFSLFNYLNAEKKTGEKP
jgi:hypothetical protein